MFYEDDDNNITLGSEIIVRRYSRTPMDFSRFCIQLRNAVTNHRVSVIRNWNGQIMDVDDFISTERGLLNKFLNDMATS